MDTMQMGATGVAIEREINAQLRAEIDRLRAANAELLAACEALAGIDFDTEWLWQELVAAQESAAAAVASARAAGGPEGQS